MNVRINARGVRPPQDTVPRTLSPAVVRIVQFRKPLCCLAVLAITVLRAANARAFDLAPAPADYYVSPNGNNASDGSAAHPWASIAHASKVANAGDTIHVRPGKYYGSIVTNKSGTLHARLQYRSDVPWAAKIDTGSATDPYAITWTQYGDYTDIIGFDITGSGFTGIFVDGSHDRVIGNHIHHIPAGHCKLGGGAGVYLNAPYHDLDAIANVVHDIGTHGRPCPLVHGIYYGSAGGHIYDNIVYRNQGWGIHLWHGATTVIVANNLVFNNAYGGILVGASEGEMDDDTVVANNIVVYNGVGFGRVADAMGYGIQELGTVGAHNLYIHNVVYGNLAGALHLNHNSTVRGTILADPRFVHYDAAGTGDYHLRSDSPAIGAGTALWAPSTDIEGRRWTGTVPNIGPYSTAGGSARTAAP